MSTSDADTPTPVAELSYERARDELVQLVARIESGQVPLEESMALWERGEELAAHCQAKLDAAQDTLDRATGQGEQAAGDGEAKAAGNAVAQTAEDGAAGGAGAGAPVAAADDDTTTSDDEDSPEA